MKSLISKNLCAFKNFKLPIHGTTSFFINTPILVTLLFIGFIAAGCSDSYERADSQTAVTKLFSYNKSGNYFKLRDSLQDISNTDEPEILFLSAVVHHAFNKPEASNKIIEQLIPKISSLPDTLVSELYSLKLENHMRLHQYSEGLEAAEAIVTNLNIINDSASVADATNISLLLKALADVPPQKITTQKTTTLQMERDKAGLQRIPVSIGGFQRRFVVDTGANYSVLMRSEAEMLGLKIREAGIMVNSATGGKVRADVAVAGEVTLGDVVFHNVMFLVFPDEALSFPQIDYRIEGIIGFPPIEAVGEIRFLENDVLEIPAEPIPQTIHNMALEGLSPRIQVKIQLSPSTADSFQSGSLVCAIDTGAPETSLLAPFYRQYRSVVEKISRPDTTQIGGAGNTQSMPIFRLQKIQLRIGDATTILENIAVHTETTFEGANSGLACNIGQDVLGQFEETILNFRSMSLILR